MLLPSGLHEGSPSAPLSAAIGVNVYFERSPLDDAAPGGVAPGNRPESVIHTAPTAASISAPASVPAAIAAHARALRPARVGAGATSDAVVLSASRSRICRSSR